MVQTANTEAELAVSIGQCSDAGRKPTNQDFHGALIPDGQALAMKGVALAIADGISSSEVSHIAAETAIKSFLNDYYCTSDAWSVKTAGERVIRAANSWLHAECRRYRVDENRGFITTLSALVLKGRTGHLFHVGDARVFHLSDGGVEQLTTDHQTVLSSSERYLARALGLSEAVEIDYRVVDLREGETFILATDGVYSFLDPKEMARIVAAHADLNQAAKAIVAAALDHGSDDNLTVQIVRVARLPPRDAADFLKESDQLPPAIISRVPSVLDGYRIVRQLHISSRSYIYVASDPETGASVALKVPAVEHRDDTDYLRRFAMEEWIARRISSAHVLKAPDAHRERTSLYSVTELVEGQTLRQWMHDNPRPDLETVRNLADQIAKGLRAFHRREMVHQDLRPENVMIDREGTVKIIDFGAVKVAGVLEAAPDLETGDILGTHQYAAPEYFLGYSGTASSDLFSLGVIVYEMLTGRLPYGERVARAETARAQAALTYRPASEVSPYVPEWMDWALRKAVKTDPAQRYESLSEFITALREPSEGFNARQVVPLAERNPLLFWQALVVLLSAVIVYLLAR